VSGTPEISLGDLIQAVARLGLTEAGAIREAAEVLGLPLGVRREAPPVQVIRPDPVRGTGEILEPTVIGGEASSAPGRPTAVPTAGDDLRVRNEGRVPPVPPAWAQAADTLRLAAAVASEPSPLLSPATTRALLAALVCGESASGPLDIERAIEILARGQALAEIPRLCLPTLRYGVQILVDRAAALLPYREDQQRVVADLRLLLPPDRVQVLRFAGNPLLAGPSTPHTWRVYVPPAAGTTVLVLSDLGLCRGEDLFEAAPVADWIDFAGRVRRAGARVTALVPYETRSWPAILRSRMTLVSWDRPTTVAEARTRSWRGAER
jgi:hypothetical protein